MSRCIHFETHACRYLVQELELWDDNLWVSKISFKGDRCFLDQMLIYDDRRVLIGLFMINGGFEEHAGHLDKVIEALVIAKDFGKAKSESQSSNIVVGQN